MVSKYYGSNNWYKDKDSYEKGSVPKIKAGVLSEDAVWNMLEDVDGIIREMQKIIKYYQKSE